MCVFGAVVPARACWLSGYGVGGNQSIRETRNPLLTTRVSTRLSLPLPAARTACCTGRRITARLQEPLPRPVITLLRRCSARRSTEGPLVFGELYFDTGLSRSPFARVSSLRHLERLPASERAHGCVMVAAAGGKLNAPQGWLVPRGEHDQQGQRRAFFSTPALVYLFLITR